MTDKGLIKQIKKTIRKLNKHYKGTAIFRAYLIEEFVEYKLQTSAYAFVSINNFLSKSYIGSYSRPVTLEQVLEWLKKYEANI